MSYNITSFKTKSMHLAFPINFDFQAWVRAQPDRTVQGYENAGKRWCLEEKDDAHIWTDLAARTWKLPLLNQELTGVIEGDTLTVTEMDWRGDGSGHLYSDILMPLFREFKGNLSALVVWEGGDTITQLDIREGVVEETELS